MELKKLIYTVEDGIAVITMNYMKNLNAIDEQMADELMYVVDAAEKDPNVKVVVLKGTPKAFSAGGDIGYFYQIGPYNKQLILMLREYATNFTSMYDTYRPAADTTLKIINQFYSEAVAEWQK